MRRLPPLSALEAFVAVARHGMLKGAAAELSLSPSALCRRIQQLETHVSRPLFERVPRGLVLSLEGKQLLDELAPLLDGLAYSLERRDSEDETLRLGLTAAFGASWLLPRLPAFYGLYPRISVEFRSVSDPDHGLDPGLDAAIVLARSAPDDLYRQSLGRSRIVAVCSESLRDRLPPLPSIDDISDQNILLDRHRPELLEIWLTARNAGQIRPRRVVTFDSAMLLQQAVRQGLGIGLLTHSGLYGEPPELVRVFKGSVPSPFSYMFVCRRAALGRRIVQQFRDWLFDEVEEATERRAPWTGRPEPVATLA